MDSIVVWNYLYPAALLPEKLNVTDSNPQWCCSMVTSRGARDSLPLALSPVLGCSALRVSETRPDWLRAITSYKTVDYKSCVLRFTADTTCFQSVCFFCSKFPGGAIKSKLDVLQYFCIFEVQTMSALSKFKHFGWKFYFECILFFSSVK